MDSIRRVATLPALPERPHDAHKGDFGRVLIVGGSPGMTGAPCLAAMAAQRAGAGLVTVALPQSLNLVAEVKLTSAMSLPLPETEEAVLGSPAAKAVLSRAGAFDAVAIGPGAGRARETTAAMHTLTEQLPGYAVVDADALNAVAGATDLLNRTEGARILTPHPGEMARLLGGVDIADVQQDRTGVAVRFAQEFKVLLALKGAGTVVTDGERVYVNPCGNPGMATGGAGDVLTGLVAGLLCQGLDAFQATQLAVFVHGLAGDLAAGTVGELSMTAEDLLDFCAEAFEIAADAGEGAHAAEVAAPYKVR